MTTGVIATLTATLALAFVEAMGRFYPAYRTWLRLRSRHGRRAVRAMRTRFERAAAARTGQRIAFGLLALIFLWVAVAGWLDKRWHEVLLDVSPYVFVGIALLRIPAVLNKIAERMRKYESDMGEDPDSDIDHGTGPDALAL